MGSQCFGRSASAAMSHRWRTSRRRRSREDSFGACGRTHRWCHEALAFPSHAGYSVNGMSYSCEVVPIFDALIEAVHSPTRDAQVLTALMVVQERYARGELSRQEFEQMRSVLEG